MTSPLLRLLGLGVRAGAVLIGVAAVRAGLQRDKLACVVLSTDAGPRTMEKVGRLATARNIPVLRGPPATELGAALGRPPLQAVGVTDPALARGLLAGKRTAEGDRSE